MDIKIGGKIAALRRQKGLTQDQLADQLGVSAPAVSKWETDNSYPDITLLCPLARALGTNVDTLLQFEENLTEQEAAEKMNAVLQAAMRDGYESAEPMIAMLLHEYPNSAALKYHAAVVWNVFHVYFPAADDDTKKRWADCAKDLLAKVRASKDANYWQTATMQLAGIALGEEELAQAELLLEELPDHSVDATMVWSDLYLKKNEPQEALKTVQKRMYVLVRQLLTCLAVLMNPKAVPDIEQELEICEAYKAVDELFGCSGLYHGQFLEIYLRAGRLEEAADCLVRYAEAATGPAMLPKKALFSPGLNINDGQKRPAMSKELRHMLVQGLEAQEEYKQLMKYPKCVEAVKKLKADL